MSNGDDPWKKRRKLPDGELDITPMIDVTFLLLIFFMVCSKMRPSDNLDVPVAHYGVGVETNQATIIRIRQGSGGAPPSMEFEDGERIDLDRLRRLVAERVRGGRKQIIIKAERFVPHATVQQAARAVQEVEGAHFYIGVQEK